MSRVQLALVLFALITVAGTRAAAQDVGTTAPAETSPTESPPGEATPTTGEIVETDQTAAGEPSTAAAPEGASTGPDAAVVAPAAEAEEAAPEVVVEFEPGEGLLIRSGDRAFSILLRPRFQILATLLTPEEILGNPEDTGDIYQDFGDFDLGLAIRRARLSVSGNVFGRENRYKVELAFSPADLGFEPGTGPTRTPLLDAYVDLRHHRDIAVRMGQYKLPYSRERVISSGNLAMVDRSLENGEFNLDRDLAVDIRSSDFLGLGMFRYYLGIGAGEGRDAGFGNDLGFTYFARVEVLPLGMFDDYSEADLERNATPRLSVGAAYAFFDEAPRLRGPLGPVAADGGTTDYHNFTADAVFMWSGLSVLAEMAWREGTRNPGMAVDAMGNPEPITAARNGLGWFVQAGYLLPWFDLEVQARVGALHPIGGPTATSLSERGEAGAGLNYYIGGHAYKIQADYFHLWAGGDLGNAEDRVRLQLQIAI